MGYNPLLLLILVPMAAGSICLIFSDRLKSIIKAASFAVTALALAVSIFVFVKKPVSWQYHSSTVFIADNLSGFIGIFIALSAFLVTIYSFGFIEKSFGRFFGYMLITLGASFGVIFANDTVLLLVFWGLVAAMLYLLVNIQATDAASRASKKALIIVGSTDALMMFGIALIWAMTGTFSVDKIRLPLTGVFSYTAYMALLIACLAKAGAIPFHSWIPEVAEDGPTPVAAYLPASLDKLLGIYLLARISLNMFVMNNISNTILALVGSITIVASVMVALVQHDLKKLLGYHAVSQVGYMVLGIGTGSVIGIAGALFHMLNNVIYKSCLFLAGGNVEKSTGTTDLERLGGLARYMPITFASFLVASLSISGIPPFNGFVSKWMIYQGIIESAGPGNPLWIVWLVCAMFGSALTVASFMKLLHAVFLGRPEKDFGNVKESPLSMTLPVMALAIICCVFGIFAFSIPISLFIAPAIGVTIRYLGIWSPVAATILILVGIVAGLFVYIMYIFVTRKGNYRVVGTFVGGEEPGGLARISGTTFYNTIKDVKAVDSFYKKEKAGYLDVYSLARRFIIPFTRFLQLLHNGVLPTYMVWCLLGMVGMFIVLLLR